MTTAKRPKIFGIGWVKTGSNSLAIALRDLGLNVQHFGTFLFHNPDETLRDKINENFASYRDPLAGLYSDYGPLDVPDAMIDWPICSVWPALFEYDHEAKFIVTHRNPHDIAFSYMRMGHRLALRGKLNRWAYSYTNVMTKIVAHYEKIFEVALKHPTRFLFLDIHDSAAFKWRVVGDFVGRDSKAMLEPEVKPWPDAYKHEKVYFTEHG